jgi:hypothetical protein
MWSRKLAKWNKSIQRTTALRPISSQHSKHHLDTTETHMNSLGKSTSAVASTLQKPAKFRRNMGIALAGLLLLGTGIF